MSVGLIYCVLNTVNGKRYIGQTTQTSAVRWSQHCSDARKRRYPLHHAITKHGAAAFAVSELGYADSQDELNRLEIEFIAVHRSADRKHGYNVRAGGNSGGKLSEETRRKIGDRHRGRVAANKGKRMPEHQRVVIAERMKNNHPKLGTHCSDVTKAMIGAANRLHMLGSKQSDETKQKRIESLLRHYANPEARQRLSLARMGHVTTEATRQKLRAIHTGRIISTDQREKLRIANLGKKQSQEASAKKSLAMTRIWQARREAIACP